VNKKIIVVLELIPDDPPDLSLPYKHSHPREHELKTSSLFKARTLLRITITFSTGS
jgi:hypothetical protein